METIITPNYVRNLSDYTEDFLCSLSDNIYNIKFLNFKVRDLDTDYLLFEVSDDNKDEDTTEKVETEVSRTIRYHLGPDFLELVNLGTELVFSVGSLPVKNLIMIEKHYFKGHLIKSFEFKFDFCIPNSVNTWETMYELPQIEDSLKSDMIDSPWETKSDSFYFVDNTLIMHHKAIYNYSQLE
jgi:hypothetical protein